MEQAMFTAKTKHERWNQGLSVWHRKLL